MTCIVCRYFQPIEPAQHKADREAGRCESHCGKRWTRTTAINCIREHTLLDLEGWCRLHPKPEKVHHRHFCGQVSVLDYFHRHWGVERIGSDEDMFQWAQETLNVVMHGTWESQQARRTEEENEELKRKLKRVQEISASRFKRLQQQKANEKPEAKEELEPRTYPHLVAAE